MADKTRISWTRGADGTAGATWNPVTGCAKVSPGCDRCYAESIATRFAGTKAYPAGFAVTLRPDRLDQPLRWTRPRMIFVNSMSDLFHADVTDDYIARTFAVMAVTPRHTYQVLTKRHARMRSLLSDYGWWTRVVAYAWELDGARGFERVQPTQTLPDGRCALRNVWLGVSVEDQKWADIRVPALLDTPAHVRFLSCEPLLGPVTLGLAGDHRGHTRELDPTGCGYRCEDCTTEEVDVAWTVPYVDGRPATSTDMVPRIDWVIVGGESGPSARPMHPQWARSLRDECVGTPTAFFFKQWGAHTPHDPGTGRQPVLVPVDPEDPAGRSAPMWRTTAKAAGSVLDDRTHAAFPVPVAEPSPELA